MSNNKINAVAENILINLLAAVLKDPQTTINDNKSYLDIEGNEIVTTNHKDLARLLGLNASLVINHIQSMQSKKMFNN